MRRSTPLRNLLIAVTATAVLFSLWRLPSAQAQSAVEITPNPDAVSGAPGTAVTRTYVIRNRTNVDRTFTLSSAPININPANSVSVTFLSNQVFVAGNSEATFQATFIFSASASTGSNLGFFNLSASSSTTPAVSASVVVQVSTTGPTPTPSPTTTVVPTSTPQPGTPTPTPPICIGGREANDPGNSLGSAQLIRVNFPELHGICITGEEQPSPDVDWYYFAAGAGKVYTIDVSQMAAGLDLVIELYDANGNFLTGNDDFFQRNPDAPSDLRPRIQSWRAPYDGFFYFLVRDKLNSGGGDRTYTIVVNGESFGPTPTQISELCNDLYEQDGLPETATFMGPNEIQPLHVLCPRGDADWIRFYGAAGKTYFFFTDTRRYSGNVNRETEAGADTIMFLFDRDGVTRLSESDDIPNSLDSEIRFVPPVDGDYFLQVKNRGDVGNQFIRYDLVLRLCVSGDTACGRAEVVAVPQTTPGTGGTQPTPSPDAGFPGNTPISTQTRTPLPTRTPTLSPSPDPEEEDDELLSFAQLWQRADRPIAASRVSRSWMWGPGPLLRVNERYNEAPGNQRTVEYYDKARMEITDPNVSRSTWFVTNGLLVVEMVRGQVQHGDQAFANAEPAAIPIAGDQDDANAPTYASLAAVTSRSSSDRTGEYVAETINRAGRIGDYEGPRREEARLARYVSQTGYNIPQVFWRFLNARGAVYENGRFRDGSLMDWVFTLGYPISDPYWTNVKVGGAQRQVLVQPFERRVLTFDPANPAGWQVEMGNVGRHYYLWRYGRELPNK